MKAIGVSLLVSVLLLSVAVATPAPAGGTEGADGAALYNAKCALCHGKDGVAKAMAKGSANLNDPAWQKATTADAVAKVVTEGKGKMPKQEGKLSPEEIRAIAEYVFTLK